MKDDKYFFDYKNEPGKKLGSYIKDTKKNPLVSIITSYYNGNEFMDQTINSVLNQTFPYWEWIIVDDGSNNEEALKYLDKLEEIDSRIKVYHKENGGLATGRDYAIEFSKTEYILPLDSDDLIEPTFIETTYWTLETNKDATWAFTNSVGFGKWQYLSDCKFDSERMKTDNHITATALIRKDKIIELDGYSVAKRYVNEDWHLWLRMLQKGYYPVQINFYGFWYRRREESLLSKISDKDSNENELRIRDIKSEADKITNKVKAKIYPIEDNLEINDDKKSSYTFIYEDVHINKRPTICYCISHLPLNKKFYKEIKQKSIKNEIYIITTENTNYSQYLYRQELEKYCIVYDLTSFLDERYYESFIKYLMKTRQIKNIEKKQMKDKKIFYKTQIIKYKLSHTLVMRAIRKMIRTIKLYAIK